MVERGRGSIINTPAYPLISAISCGRLLRGQSRRAELHNFFREWPQRSAVDSSRLLLSSGTNANALPRDG